MRDIKLSLLKFWWSTFFIIGVWQFAISQVYLDPDKNPDQYNFQHWESDDGLPDNAVIKVIQSRDGYIWFCSYGGVTRFNGKEFYTYSSYNYPEIVNNSFTFLYEDKYGVIWAATSGNGVVAIDKGNVKAYTTAHGLPGNFAESLVEDNNGVLWLATSEGLVYKTGDSFTNEGLPEELKTLNIVYLDSDEDGNLWISSQSNGIYQLSNNKIINHYTKESGLASNHINFLKCHQSVVYIGTREGLSILENNNLTSYTKADGLVDNMIISVEKSENGWLWIGSYNGFIRMRDGEFQYFSSEHPIYGRDITSLLEDQEGNLWVSTYRGGLYKFWEGKFTNYRDYTLGHIEPYTVHSILEMGEGKYLLIFEEGLSIVDTNNNTLKSYSSVINNVKDKFKCGIIDKKGRLWVGSRKNLLLADEGKLISFTKEKDGIVNNNIRTLVEDSKGRIWVGTFLGVTVLDYDKGESFNITTSEGLSHDYIMSFMEDPQGRMWIGTRSGLNIYNNGEITSYSSSDGMAGEFVFKTFIDNDGVIWIVGNAGLTRFKNGNFTPVTTKNGLLSNTLFQVIEDDFGYFWFTTNQKNVSVFKVKKEELNAFCDGKIDQVKSKAYDRSDGIKATAATSSATSIKGSDGKLWIATQQGAEVIDPSNINTNDFEPPVLIEYLRINDEPVDFSTKKIKLPFGKNRIDLGFAALSYRYPSKNKYQYMLEGYDDKWIDSYGGLETSYTNLPNGDYTFRVKATNNDNVWNEEGISVKFTIETPFYKATWFYLIAVLAGLGLILLIYRWRVSALQNARLELERIVAERTSEISTKKEEIEAQKEEIEMQREQIEKQHDELKEVNLHLEDIVDQRTDELKKTYRELLDVNKELDTFIYRSVHDIRGPIARLQGLSHLIQLQTNDADIISMVSKLNDTAEDMNDVFYRLINIVRLKTTDLSINPIQVHQVVEKVLTDFNKPSYDNTHKVIIDIDKSLSFMSNQPTLETIIFQLVDNAIKFRKADQRAEIKIRAWKEGSNIELTVADRGQGIEDTEVDKVFDMFHVGNDDVYGAGLGLYTVNIAAKVLKGEVRITKNAIHDGETVFHVTLLDQA